MEAFFFPLGSLFPGDPSLNSVDKNRAVSIHFVLAIIIGEPDFLNTTCSSQPKYFFLLGMHKRQEAHLHVLSIAACIKTYYIQFKHILVF